MDIINNVFYPKKYEYDFTGEYYKTFTREFT